MISFRRNESGDFERFNPPRDSQGDPYHRILILPPSRVDSRCFLLPSEYMTLAPHDRRRGARRSSGKGRRLARRYPAKLPVYRPGPEPIMLEGRMYGLGDLRALLYLAEGDQPTPGELRQIEMIL